MIPIKFLQSSYFKRLSIYLSIWLFYLLFMSEASQMGIDWLPFQEERVRNSVDHIINNSSFIKYGVTSWESLDSYGESIKSLYAVQLHEYLHYLFLLILGGEKLFSTIAPHIDKIIVFCLSSIISESCIKIFENKNNLSKNTIGIASFLVFSTLPYTYKMLLSLWQDVYFLLFLWLAFFLFSQSKNKLGLIVLIYGCLWQYHFSFLFGLFYLLSYIYLQISDSNKKLIILFPPGFRNKKKSIILILSFCISPLVSIIQNLLLKLNGFQLTNSGILTRVGIDNHQNFHHGGWLSALQFLGGNRITFCIQPEVFSNLNFGNINLNQIFSFNCVISILGFAIISIISIISYSVFAKNNPHLRWILVPIAITFLFFILIFQQALAAHLQGHSIYFAPIFTIGIISIFFQVPWLSKRHFISHVVFTIIISAIVITNIKVSFLTGING